MLQFARHLKMLFLFAGMLLSLKPIIGFGIIGHVKDPAELNYNYNLLQKLFSKRKQDYLDEDLVEILAIQRGLKDAPLSFVWELCGFIFGVITPVLIFSKAAQRYLLELFLQLIPKGEIYLSTGKLTI